MTSTEKTWVRNIGMASVVLNKNNDIVAFIQDIKLEAIKYKDHKKLINPDNKLPSTINVMTNPNFGVFDLETFNDIDNSGQIYSRVYALGFLTNNGNDLTTYYLTDHFSNTVEGSAKLVLKCLDNMLVSKYHNFIFYVHNLGRFDVIFLYKILLDYNSKLISEGGSAKYILEPLYRDNQILRLTVKLKNIKQIKISFVDSLNLLNSSLADLCKDYNVETSKGIFPYAFVNKNNLNYVGPTPNIEYYNNNIDIVSYTARKLCLLPHLRSNGIYEKKL